MRMRKTSVRGASLEQIEVVYRKELPHYRRVAQAIVGDRELACDVVQAAFVFAIKGRERFRGHGSIEGWIYRAVINEARDRVRGRTVVSLDEWLPADDEQPEIDGRWVRRAVAELPERQRLVLFLRYFGGLDYQAIADVLEIKPGTVAATLSAARESLRARLGRSERESTNNKEEDRADLRRAL